MEFNTYKISLDAYINLMLAMIIVGSSVVVGKMLIMEFPVFLVSGLRFAIATIIIWPIILMREKKFPKIIKKDWITFLLMAFCGQFIFTVLMLIGLKYIQAMAAGMITSTTPAFMAVVSILILKEQFDLRKTSGIILATLGVLVINGAFLPQGSEGNTYESSILGTLLICGAVMGEAFFLLLSKKITSTVSDLCTTGILCALGLVMFLPFSIYEGLYFNFSDAGISDWLYMFYFGAVYTVAGYIFWFRGVKKVSGSTASAFTAVIPMSAIIISVICLGESLTLLHAIGFIFIVASIFLTAPVKREKVLAARDGT